MSDFKASSSSPSRSGDRRALGRLGEDAAAQYLQEQGYRLLARNWRYGRAGELDLIALAPDHALIVFIEVKTRRSLSAGTPFEAVTPAKQRTLALLAQAFLAENPQYQTFDARFDVMGAYIPSCGPRPTIQMEHLQNVI